MSPTFSRGANGRSYRYYVSAPLQQGRRIRDRRAIRRLPGAGIEALLDSIVRRIAPREPAPLAAITSVEVYADNLQLLMPVRLLAGASQWLADYESAQPDPASPTQMRLTVPIRARMRGGLAAVVGSTISQTRHDRPMIKALRHAHSMVGTATKNVPMMDVAPATPYLRRIVKLAYLAPDLQRMIFDGRQPSWLTLERLTRGDFPINWTRQRAIFTSSAPA